MCSVGCGVVFVCSMGWGDVVILVRCSVVVCWSAGVTKSVSLLRSNTSN